MTNLGDDVGAHYRATRERLGPLVLSLSAAQLSTAVPCLPLWTVRDTLGHVVGIVDDAVNGRLRGIPDEEQTAAQVVRMQAYSTPDLIAHWNTLAPLFEEVVSASAIAPAAGDVTAHEQDIRGALGLPGGRDAETVAWFAGQLLTSAATRLDSADAPGFVVHHEAGTRTIGSLPSDLVLRTSQWEIFRAFFGRRSRNQLLQMQWNAPADAVVDHLPVFACSTYEIIE